MHPQPVVRPGYPERRNEGVGDISAVRAAVSLVWTVGKATCGHEQEHRDRERRRDTDREPHHVRAVRRDDNFVGAVERRCIADDPIGRSGREGKNNAGDHEQPQHNEVLEPVHPARIRLAVPTSTTAELQRECALAPRGEFTVEE